MPSTRTRSFVKALSYRITSSLLTVLVVFFFTGNATVSFGIGGVDALVKVLWYYSHERWWKKTRWGKYG